MSAPICPYCGDGMESIGTLNHIECATKLMAEVRRLRSLINGKLDALLTATAPKEKEGGRVMDAFEEYKQVTHGMSEEGFVAYPLVQAVIEELNSWQAEDEPDMVRVQRERAEQAEADTEYHKGQAKLWHTALQDALTRADEAEAALAAERERRCDECESREGSSHYCLLWTINTPDEHYCRDWTARDSGGGAS